ncbi:VWA domain-containing protein [Paenibacillus mesophilus]|uniref:VWA domain-containing protein n=1 Tax=Paenibacillus mesophilus TaxID=2582849 RepID=UPI00110DCDE8|nr:VWA domain-containing protein [Paenibacillus mesophilus]TMV43197.1 VWA domain-containing protein [Paenibacillus mesophilus]
MKVEASGKNSAEFRLDWESVGPDFPFSAIVGQENAKLALLMHAINPRLGGVLLGGERGSGKTMLIRAISALVPDKRLVEVPLNATEDRVIGSVDVKSALLAGKRSLQPGLLHEANGNMLHLDEINLLPESVLQPIMEAASSGLAAVEREGLSIRNATRFLMFATMNPEEGLLPAAVSDHFGLYVHVGGERQPAARTEIVKSRLAYERDPNAFVQGEEVEMTSLRSRLAEAKERLSGVVIDAKEMELAVMIAREANCPGHRAELFLVEAAKAIAAWKGVGQVRAEELRKAASFVLPHRMRNRDDEKQGDDHGSDDSGDTSIGHRENGSAQQADKVTNPEPQHGSASEIGSDNSCSDDRSGDNPAPNAIRYEAKEIVEAVGEPFDVRKLNFSSRDKLLRSGSGRRALTRSDTSQGRYVRATTAVGKITDVAFDATFRAAAPYQTLRRRGKIPDTSIVVEREDLRMKRRERRVGATLLFVVDASGSMAAQQRMRAVKGAILSLLRDAYRKRDNIGMIAFRKQTAEQLLPFTRSVEAATIHLRELPTGGKTPLAAGLLKGWETLQVTRARDKNIVPVMIVVTDGKANAGLRPGLSDSTAGGVWRECLNIGEQIGKSGIIVLVIDTEQGFVRLGQAALLAEAMQGDCYRLEHLDESAMTEAIRGLLGKRHHSRT